MASQVRGELIELSTYAWQRFLQRMAGLTAEELAWEPTEDPKLSLHWRLEHIADTLSEPRTASWLGLSVPDAFPLGPPDPALNACRAAHEIWLGRLHQVSDEELAEPVGAAAGAYAEASRLSFVLHILDEVIHHTAEAALLRDLYASRTYHG